MECVTLYDHTDPRRGNGLLSQQDGVQMLRSACVSASRGKLPSHNLCCRKRMVELAAQKFVADVAADAKRKHELRMQSTRKDKVGGKVRLTDTKVVANTMSHC